ncbi:multidrug transporter [Pseudoclavibacter sp. RFBG4]|nr:multidrug transporter [Pseudoclavibacter sp. RFBG4]
MGGRRVVTRRPVASKGPSVSVLTRLSLKYRILIGLLTAAIAAAGIISTAQLKQELMPSVEVPQGFVTATLTGASPDVMVTEVTEPIENALRGVSEVQSVTSTTSEGFAQIIVAWSFDADKTQVEAELRSAVESTKSLRPESSTAELNTFSLDALPVLTLGASSDTDTATLSKTLTDSVLPALSQVDGVQNVEVSGTREERVEISLRQADVEALEIDTASIEPTLSAAGIVLPAGDVTSGTGEISVQVGSQLSSLDAIRALPFTTEDSTVLLSQFADVDIKEIPATSISRVNGAETLTLSITKASDASTVSVAHGVTEKLAELTPGLPSNVVFTEIENQAPYIEQSIHDLSVEGGLGLIFAVLVIFLFLASFRSTIVAAISIPMSLLITMVGLNVGEYSLNILTLGALTIAVGRVVDDSIVVIENIKRRQGDGALTIEGIVGSVGQVAGAITASTLTTVAVFLPIAFVGDIVGQLFRPFAVTVSIALVASLVVALTIVPVFAYWMLRRPSKPMKRERFVRARAAQAAWTARQEEAAEARWARQSAKLDGKNEKREQRGKSALPVPAAAPGVVAARGDGEEGSPYDGLQRAFVPILDATLRHPRRTIAAALALLLLTGIGATALRSDFLGSMGDETVLVEQELPQGTTIDQSLAGAEKLEAVLATKGSVETFVSSIGTGGAGGFGGGGGQSTSITVIPAEGQDAETVANSLRADFAGVSDVGEVTVTTAASSALASDVQLAIQGNDADSLSQAATQLGDAVKDLPGVTAVSNDLSTGGNVVMVDVDRSKAAGYGYTQATVGQAVSAALTGTPLGTVRLEGVDRDIVIAPTQGPVALDQLALMQLPVTAVQQQRAITDATDAFTEEQETKAEEQEAEAVAQMQETVDDAVEARDTVSAQLGELQTQLATLQTAPLTPAVPDAGSSMTPEQAAQAERDAQISALTDAIAQAESGIEQANAGVDAAVKAQEDMAAQSLEAKELQARQEGLADTKATPIRLGDIAEVREEATPGAITRNDGARQVTVSVTPAEGQLGTVTQAVYAATDGLELPAGVTFVVGGASADQDESFQQLGMAMLLAIVLVFLIMVATFRSLMQPLILLVSVPFAATGAVALLLLTDTPLGLPSLIGLLMLIGIVVTNAIVLIDLINHIRERGSSVHDAIVHGTRLRLRPILMTAAATIFALVPMSLGLTGGGVFISKPLAIVVIGGLISSTLLTLVLVPVLYSSVERRNDRRAAKRAARKERKAEAAAEKTAVAAAPARS